MKCPICERRPSERHGHADMAQSDLRGPSWQDCPDPIHALADAALDMADALRDIVDIGSASSDPIAERCVKYASAALTLATIKRRSTAS